MVIKEDKEKKTFIFKIYIVEVAMIYIPLNLCVFALVNS